MKWLIDGHNLIGQMPNIRLDDPHDEEKLLGYLRSFRARTGHSLTVVFDAGPTYQTGSNQKRGGITVQFVPSGQIADQILVRRIRKVKNPQEVMVVTSDQAVAQIARQAGIRVTPSGEFARQLLQMQTNPDGEDDQANVSLTANEVDEWLDIFNQ
jgi:predicted RNA-binding protein with PIN domain